MSVNYVLSVLWFWRLHILYLKSAQLKWQLDYEWLLIWNFRICKYKTFIYISFFFFIICLIKYIFSEIWELVSRLLIELQSSSKNQKNPHDQLSGVGDTFQSSSYHSFPLKPGRIKNTPSPNKNSVSQFPVSFWAI